MGLGEVANEVIVHAPSSMGKGKGKLGKNGEERDDDSHYFESYSYNGACVALSPGRAVAFAVDPDPIATPMK